MFSKQTTGMWFSLIMAIGIATPALAKVKSKRGRPTEFQVGTTTLFVNNKAEQNGQELPGGTSIYSQFNLQVKFSNIPAGAGIAYQYDKIGTSQVNNGVLLKGEFTVGDFYTEIGFGTAEQTFVNRAISSRSGTQTVYGVGLRFPTSFLSWLYFDGGVRVREINYSKQDGVELKSMLSETFIMPFIGGGILL